MSDDMLVSVALGALGNVIADAIAATSKATHGRYRRDPEHRALSAVVARASSDAFSTARHADVLATDDWIDVVAEQWTPAFTPDVVSHLMLVIATPSAGNQRRFERVIRAALEDAGCDLATLEQTVSVEEFAYAFPDQLWRELMRAAYTPDLRELTQFLLVQRAEHRDSGPEPAGPRDYRHDLSEYLQAVLDDARGGLPEFLPRVRAANLNQRVRVRVKSRVSDISADQQADRAYQPPVEYAGLPADDPERERSWEELRRSARQIVVLSDPGLGKSWLVRNETIRLAFEALGSLDDDRDVVIPVPIRADQLAEASGRSIGEVAARYFTGKGRLAERSRAHFAEQVDAGSVHLLVDGLDEVPDDTRRNVRTALADWCRRPGERRWIVTSRIAGYTSVESRDTTKIEVELLSLTDDQVEAYVRAWGLRASAEGRLLTALADPAVSGMARIPLLLALLCSLADSGEDIPRTRAAVYERVLLWFLERPHRGSDRSGRDNETLLELVAGVAFHFANRDRGWADLMLRSALTQAVRAQPMFRELACTADQLVERLSVYLGLIVPEGDWSGGRRARYLFVHRTFAEYLVARHLAALDEQRRWAVIERHLWFDPEWLQVISMLGGLLEDDDTRRLVAQLSDAGDDAFRHAMLMAIRVVSEHPKPDRLLAPSAQQALRHTLDAALRHPDLRWSVVTALRGVPVLAPVAVRVLLDLTEADDMDVRLAAVRSLTGVDTPESAARLIARLRDDDERVAEEAAKALAGRPSSAVVNALLAETFADRSRVTRACVDALSALPGTRRIQAVTPYLSADQPAAVRTAAYPILKGAGASAMPLILTGLADEDPDVFSAAAEAVDRPLDPRAEAALLRRLSAYMDETAAGDDMIVWNGSVGHRRDRDAQAARAALDRGGSQAPGFTAAYLRQVIDRADILDHLGEHTGPTAPTATLIHELLLRLRGPAGLPQRKAARVLRAMRPDGIDEALAALLSASDRATMIAALEAAHGRRDDGLFAKVTELLTHPDDDIRADAMEIVIEREPPDLDDVLLAGLHDTNPQVRRLAADACVGRGDVRLVSALVERIRLPQELTGVVVSAIRALRDREEQPGVRDALLACLRNETDGAESEVHQTADDNAPPRRLLHLGPPIYVAAARALAKVEPDAVLAELKAHSGMHNGYLGREVAAALTRCSAPGTVDFLLTMRREGSRKTRIAAYHALYARPYPEDLVTLVDRLDGQPSEMLHDMLRITGALAAQHYHHPQLSEGDRLHVRRTLTEAIDAGGQRD